MKLGRVQPVVHDDAPPEDEDDQEVRDAEDAAFAEVFGPGGLLERALDRKSRFKLGG